MGARKKYNAGREKAGRLMEDDVGRKMMKPAILIMTATIIPPDGVPNLKRVDPVLRLNDYLDALHFYLGLPDDVLDRIVFLENSAADISELHKLVKSEGKRKKVEFISFNGLNFPSEYGRAYGEFKMLDFGFENSSLLQALGEIECFWKVTGRLKILNFHALVAKAPKSYDVIIDFMSHPTPMVDLRFFSCTREGYRRHFEGIYDDLREDTKKISAEGNLYLQWSTQYRDLKIVPRHLLQPKISGVGGQHNVDYLAGLNIAKYWIRVVTRIFLPRLWI